MGPRFHPGLHLRPAPRRPSRLRPTVLRPTRRHRALGPTLARRQTRPAPLRRAAFRSQGPGFSWGSRGPRPRFVRKFRPPLSPLPRRRPRAARATSRPPREHAKPSTAKRGETEAKRDSRRWMEVMGSSRRQEEVVGDSHRRTDARREVRGSRAFGPPRHAGRRQERVSGPGLGDSSEVRGRREKDTAPLFQQADSRWEPRRRQAAAAPRVQRRLAELRRVWRTSGPSTSQQSPRRSPDRPSCRCRWPLVRRRRRPTRRPSRPTRSRLAQLQTPDAGRACAADSLRRPPRGSSIALRHHRDEEGIASPPRARCAPPPRPRATPETPTPQATREAPP